MAEIIFTFNGIQTTVHCDQNDIMKDICKTYSFKIKKNVSDLVFFYNGLQLKEDLAFIQVANSLDKERNKMAILVNEINPDIPEEEIKQTKKVLCPDCGENIKIKFEKYNVKLFGCKNGHKSEKSFAEFQKLINIDESKIVCDLCKDAKKSDVFKNIFYYCFTCNLKFCPLCKSKHEKNKEHKIIEYDLKNYFCGEHNEPYNSYCKKCEKNICLNCLEYHDGHKIIYYQNILPKKNEKLKECQNLKNNIDKMTKYINELIKKFQEIKKNYEILYEVEMDIINNYSTKNINYETLYNINELNNWIYIQDSEKIINDNTRIKEIFEIYHSIDERKVKKHQNNNSSNNNKNLIKITYKIDTSSKEKQLKIFGKIFVDNNKDKCSIEYSSFDPLILGLIKSDLKEKINIENIKNEILEITLNGIDNITDISYMFDGCKSLLALNDISQWNTSKITNMSHAFNKCELLFSLSDISNWNTSNVIDMSYMFSGCSSLTSLPDISKWDISKVENLSFMFSGKPPISSFLFPNIMSSYSMANTSVTNSSNLASSAIGAVGTLGKGIINIGFGIGSIISGYGFSSYSKKINTSLENLPDISKWNTSKVKNMKGIFSFCSSLKNLPNISNWNTSNVTDMSNIFIGCSSLKNLPDISRWNISKVVDINSIFNCCSSLENIPNVSKWNTSNITNMSGIFEDCKSLKSLPDISEWKTSKVINIEKIFKGCECLKNLPDISKWDICKIENMSGIFNGCKSLKDLPDISKWDTSNAKDLSYIFSGCKSLKTLPDISKWKTSKIQNMERMYCSCESLVSLPDISKWSTFNVITMNSMFYGCKSLKSIPDISKWDTHNVIDMDYMFYDCKSLISLPNISEWNISSLKKNNSMFEGCSKELNIPKKFKGCLIF